MTARRNFSFARHSICRTRSRETCSRSPICCSVRRRSSQMPELVEIRLKNHFFVNRGRGLLDQIA
jgi:hypothetical protein